MKRFLVFAIALILLISTVSTLAEGQSKSILPYEGEPVVLSYLGWESFKPVQPGTKFYDWMQEKLGNITLEFNIPVADTSAKIQTALASGEMDDILIHRDPGGFVANYGDGSRTVNLLDYAELMPEYMARREAFPHLKRYDVDGKAFLLFPAWFDIASPVWKANIDILNKYDLEVPKTYEEMVEVMDKVLPNEPEMFGILFHTWGFESIFTNYSHLFGGYGGPTNIYYDYEQDKWVYGILGNLEVSKLTTEKMAEAYQKGYLSKDFMAYPDDGWTTVLNNGLALFQNTYPDLDATEDQIKVLKHVPIIIDPPAAEGIKPYIQADYTSDVTFWALMISSTSKHPDLAAAVLELISSEEFAVTSYWGWEGETYEIVDGQRKFKEEYVNLSQKEKEEKYGLVNVIPYTFRQILSTVYTGDAYIEPWTDEHKQAIINIGNKLSSGEFTTYYGRVAPRFDPITQQDQAVIKTAVDTFVSESLTAFVLGNKPMSEWDDFINEIPFYGDIESIVQQYNDAKQQPDRPTQFERKYVGNIDN